MKTMNSFNDQQLISLYLKGNSDAISTLIERHKDRIFTTIILMVRDKYVAEDLFQDCFIHIIDKLNSGRYNEEGKFLPWVTRLAHNLVIDHLRKVKRKPVILTSADHDIFDTINFSDDGVDKKMMNEQSYEKVNKLLDMLPEEQKEVIIMRHFGELSFKEISNVTGCSINTALGRMRYGLINIRKMMTEKQIAL